MNHIHMSDAVCNYAATEQQVQESGLSTHSDTERVNQSISKASQIIFSLCTAVNMYVRPGTDGYTVSIQVRNIPWLADHHPSNWFLE